MSVFSSAKGTARGRKSARNLSQLLYQEVSITGYHSVHVYAMWYMYLYSVLIVILGNNSGCVQIIFLHFISDVHSAIQALGERMSRMEDTQCRLLDILTRMEQSTTQREKTYTQSTMCTATQRSANPRFCLHTGSPTYPTTCISQTPSTPIGHSANGPPYFDLHSVSTPNTVNPEVQDAVSARSCDDTPNPDDLDSLTLTNLYANVPLPSTEIKKEELVPVDIVLQNKQPKDKPSTIAQKLAKEAIFGHAVMRKCTPGGTKDMPALPKPEMQLLKNIVFRAFPKFCHSPNAYEKEWKVRCWPAIEQACGRLRRCAL